MDEKGKILVAIVGSHVDTVTEISNYLETHGFKTVWAYLGNEAVPLCQSTHPDLIIMDVVMSGMGGFEVAKILPNQKFLFMTAMDELENKASTFRNSIGLIKKPIDFEELESKIKKHFKIPMKSIA
ncbi:response regulator [Candidatus Pacearchaeota archaeon]|nr:response regulator [Candidatus Pacearchaeota archaeon]